MTVLEGRHDDARPSNQNYAPLLFVGMMLWQLLLLLPLTPFSVALSQTGLLQVLLLPEGMPSCSTFPFRLLDALLDAAFAVLLPLPPLSLSP